METACFEISGFDAVYDEYFDMVYRICFVYFHGHTADAEDAAQTVFMRYLEADNAPAVGEHTKAWLIVTAQNVCKTMLRRHHRKDKELDSAAEKGADFEYREVMDAVMRLPENERMAVYLNLYEGYTAAETAKLMGCRENTVYSYIHRARKKLKKELGG
ncbi:MAG: sigma-70 family RNA polymerase sigma factor [Ruminococcus sp.]|uniref:RNA polymerase sigma-70 factor, ECF subfamily n=1 Tax=Ruminococcus albus TaxID=1264 RepID=A0A1I1N7P5_RUMAL|nr:MULTISPECIES: sigma-70 family RNA polymerase sigma factor [Ruminococcus]MBO4865503.1 sigma-70 family RNA polymerase sigma factor [Ruminococcus sp.]SFC90803.1 RNA polymerase sigma-70 factor, ECF subfamily [Ruminococcus albus]